MNSPSAATQRYPRVLSIAGSDSGGGAGIQADIKTISALGCYAMTAVTAITAQNTVGVTAVHAVPLDVLKAQIVAVMDDIGIDALKIGMLHSPEVVDLVVWAIEHYKIRHVVLDPVMVAASGDPLIAPETVAVLQQRLFPLATVITPNLDEAALLLGRPITSPEMLDQAARDLLALGAPAALLKGGHLPGERVVDVLAIDQSEWLHLETQRIETRNIHGSGCTLSSAIASYLALGLGLPEAVRAAHGYTLQAIAAGARISTGHGHGPLNHSYAPRPMQLLSAD